MEWIKKRYDQFILLLAAVLLTAGAVLIFLKVQSFPESFAEAHVQVVPGSKIPPIDLAPLQAAQAELDHPAHWRTKKEGLNDNIFVPVRYIVSDQNIPVKSGEGSIYKDSLTGAPIPNSFFIDNNLRLLDPNVPKQDPDGDGFTNEDEARGTRDGENVTLWHGPTDPNNPASHPPFHTKLFFKQWIRVPFRLLFQAYDGDVKKPEEMSFQLNAIDRGRKTEFLKLGEKVGNSDFKLEKFEQKSVVNASTGAESDVSELTVRNISNNETTILVLGRQTDSPDSYALFDYQFGKGGDIKVKKLQEFVLLPEKEKRYKLINVSEGRAEVILPDGGKYVVVPDPRKH